jgi:branched-chain amino acid transport system permease protein
MAVIGGVESLAGAVIGAVVIYIASEELRDFGQMRFVLLGAAIILTQRFVQNGLIAPLLARLARRPRTVPVTREGAATGA